MALVRMKLNITGTRNGDPWPAIGGTIELPDHEAADMVVNGYCAYASPGDEPVADDTAASEAGDQEVPLEERSVKELKQLAEERGVELAGAKKRDDIAAVLRAAEEANADAGSDDTAASEAGDQAADGDADAQASEAGDATTEPQGDDEPS